MAKFTDVLRATLQGHFDAGDQPSEANFDALILAIQEGIEEHDHDDTGDGDGKADLGITSITGAGVDIPDSWYLGIGAGLERIAFDTGGFVDVLGAKLGLSAAVVGKGASWLDMYMNTADAADSKGLRIGGGGDISHTRGAYITLHGNEHAGSPGDLIIRAGSTGNIIITGKVGIGLDPAHALDIEDNVAGYVAKFFNDGGNVHHGIIIQCGDDADPNEILAAFRDGDGTTVGYIEGDGAGGVNYFSSSDVRAKNIIGPIDQDLAMKALAKVDPIQYTGKRADRKRVGFSAQDMHRYFPEVADEHGLSYERLVPVLWAVCQSLLGRIEQLEA